MMQRALAVFTQDTKTVCIVHVQIGIVALTQLQILSQWGDVAIHAKHRIHRYQFMLGGAGFKQGL